MDLQAEERNQFYNWVGVIAVHRRESLEPILEAFEVDERDAYERAYRVVNES